uniref:Uncharacterized protein LOC111103103 n=1 Tax=Crassostrea virginica TaxID=6565 RepID=A0A8B8AKX5_CRAVI|nr:uncharacterized protein LOC111103103 [Crassostrea virginica]
MIGDTKTGPLSLIAGQDSHKREPVKKTRKADINLPRSLSKSILQQQPPKEPEAQDDEQEGQISQTLKELRNFTLAPPLHDFQVRPATWCLTTFTAIILLGVRNHQMTYTILWLESSSKYSINCLKLKHGTGITH